MKQSINLSKKKFKAIIGRLMQQYEGLVIRDSYAEIGLYYNPGDKLPRGKYFVTFKESDGKNDQASGLGRANVGYRLSFKISPESFKQRFQLVSLPKRASKGGIISFPNDSAFKYNPEAIDTLMPHPVYGWMSWVCVIDPSEETINKLFNENLFDESYTNAYNLFHM